MTERDNLKHGASPPHWRLPAGVTRGLWEYVHNDFIAEDYDEFFAETRLFDFDEQVMLRAIDEAGSRHDLIADLGCGTGRALVAACRRGYRGLAIDLSQPMLDVVREKARLAKLPIDCLRANLVELDCLAADSVDHAVCLFSTLGMIRPGALRHQVLRHARRIIKPGGAFVIHVHNYWYNLYDAGGPWWLLGNLSQSWIRRDVEAGDKYFAYRGVPNMFLHVFTKSELVGSLRRAGFRVREVIPLDAPRHRALRWRWWLPRLRANGWIAVCG